MDLREDPSVREKLAKQKMQPVRKEDGEKMAKELGAVKYVECSALTQFKLKDVFDEVCSTPPKMYQEADLDANLLRRLLRRWSPPHPKRSRTSA